MHLIGPHLRRATRGCSCPRRARRPAHAGGDSRRWRRWPCPTCPRRSVAAWWRSTCSIPSASGCRCRRPRCRPPTRASRSRTRGRLRGCGATGAARPGSTPRGWCGSDWSGWDTTEPAEVLAEARRRRRGRQRAARVLRPVHRRAAWARSTSAGRRSCWRCWIPTPEAGAATSTSAVSTQWRRRRSRRWSRTVT